MTLFKHTLIAILTSLTGFLDLDFEV
jgi:hypothetical protein